MTQDAFVELLRHWDTVRRFDLRGLCSGMRLPAWWSGPCAGTRADAAPRSPDRAALPPATAPGDLDVLNAVSSLPLRQRTAVVLFYFEQRTVAEVAALMGLLALHRWGTPAPREDDSGTTARGGGHLT